MDTVHDAETIIEYLRESWDKLLDNEENCLDIHLCMTQLTLMVNEKYPDIVQGIPPDQYIDVAFKDAVVSNFSLRINRDSFDSETELELQYENHIDLTRVSTLMDTSLDVIDEFDDILNLLR